MVDVGSRARYPSVVENPEAVSSELVQTMTQSLFAEGADVPRPG